MGRRKKDPPPPRSTSWETYRPQDDLYWKFGGPTIPPEEIEPEAWSTRYTASHLKDPKKKVAYLAELIEKYQKDLDEAVELYLDLAARGIDAMKHEWLRADDRKLDAQAGDWVMVARNVDRHRSSCYRTIRLRKGQIAAMKRDIAEIEAEKLPLLFGRGS